MKLDKTDKKILYYLDVDARMSASQIAKELQLSKETVNFRIRRLSENKILRVHYALFDVAKLGYSLRMIFIELHGTTPEIEKEIFQFLRGENCTNLRACEGLYDLVFLYMSRNTGELKQFMHRLSDLYGRYISTKALHIVTDLHHTNKKMLHGGKSHRWSFSLAIRGGYDADETDKKIINTLSKKARLPVTEIAQKAGISAKVAQYRLRRLESSGVVLTYSSIVDFDQLGSEPILISIDVNKSRAVRRMIEFFDATNQAIFAYELLGKYDLAVEIYVENDVMLRKILAEFKEQFKDELNDYDIFHIFREHVVGWSPFAHG